MDANIYTDTQVVNMMVGNTPIDGAMEESLRKFEADNQELTSDDVCQYCPEDPLRAEARLRYFWRH